MFEDTDEELITWNVNETKKTAWSHQLTKLLVNTRFDMEDEFTNGETSKMNLWKKCCETMESSCAGINFSPQEIRKKFCNMIVTYNRIKKRLEKSDNAPINWEYYEMFENVYGARHNTESNDMFFDCGDNNKKQMPSTSKSSRKRKSEISISEFMDYMKREDEKEAIRVQKILKIEEEKNALEREKINLMKELLNVLKSKSHH